MSITEDESFDGYDLRDCNVAKMEEDLIGCGFERWKNSYKFVKIIKKIWEKIKLN